MTGSKLEDTVMNGGMLIGSGVGGVVSAVVGYYLLGVSGVSDTTVLVVGFGGFGAIGGMFLGMLVAGYIAVRYCRNSHPSSEQ